MKITKNGRNLLTEDVDFVCNRCGCEFTFEVGDNLARVKFIDPYKYQGNAVGIETLEYYAAVCPECGGHVEANATVSFAPLEVK